MQPKLKRQKFHFAVQDFIVDDPSNVEVLHEVRSYVDLLGIFSEDSKPANDVWHGDDIQFQSRVVESLKYFIVEILSLLKGINHRPEMDLADS